MFDAMTAEAYAELGFIVVMVDGRGSHGRSKAFHDESYGGLGQAGHLDDHVAVIKELGKRYSYMDLDRVGIYGTSGGGYASTHAILTYPDFFKVAVSDAGNHDQRGYLLVWGESYNGPEVGSNYTAAANPGHSMFDNVFVNPSSYRSFLATGTWPDKTTLVLEVRGAENPTSINKRGHTQSADIMGMEIHIKDNGKWSFYDLSGDSTEATLIPRPADCYACHEAHAAVDTTFVQFYPTLLPLAKSKNTLSPAFLKEMLPSSK